MSKSHRIRVAPGFRDLLDLEDEMLKKLAGAGLEKVPFALAMAAGLGMTAMGVSLPAAAGQPPLTFYACQKDGKVIPGTIQIDEEPTCHGGATVVYWTQDRDPIQIGGTVASNGKVVSGKGFTAKWVRTGVYHVVFDASLVKKDASMTVTQFGVLQTFTTPVVTGSTVAGGKRVFEIWMTAAGLTYDNAFMFNLVQPAH